VSLPFERSTVRLSVGDMAYADLGEGPPVLLLHGFPTSADLWRREAWLLAQRMRVVAPDLIGYGQSERPIHADLSEPAQAAYVTELLGTLGIHEVAVVGHDIGGAVAQMVALDGAVEVRALVLLDAACFEAWPAKSVRFIQEVRSEQETASFVEEAVRAAFTLGIAHRERVDPELIDVFVKAWSGDPGAFFRAVRGITGKGLAGREGELEGLDLPALIIWGEEDPFLPSALAERLGDALPFSTTALLPGCSHFVTADAPQVVGPLMFEFLRLRYLGETLGHGHARESEPVPVFLERPPGEAG
jgi:2-hydroxymuconate-semialdehyde hydrolase